MRSKNMPEANQRNTECIYSREEPTTDNEPLNRKDVAWKSEEVITSEKRYRHQGNVAGDKSTNACIK